MAFMILGLLRVLSWVASFIDGGSLISIGEESGCDCVATIGRRIIKYKAKKWGIMVEMGLVFCKGWMRMDK